MKKKLENLIEMPSKVQWTSKVSLALTKSIAQATSTPILIAETPGPLSFVLHDGSGGGNHKVCKNSSFIFGDFF